MADEQGRRAGELAASVRRLAPGDRHLAREMFVVIADVFEETSAPLSDDYIDRLLASANFWALAAVVEGSVIGGLTAHTLPMTSSERSKVFIFDIAVAIDHQRHGVGRRLVSTPGQVGVARGGRIDAVAGCVHAVPGALRECGDEQP